MGTISEIRDADAARRWLAQGLWLQRVLAPAAAMVRPALRWALEVASVGQPLPPVGFVADVGQLVLGADWAVRRESATAHLPGVPPALPRTYEDYVLGKLSADWTFARAADALRGYQGEQQERDRARGLAFLVGQFRARADFAATELSPAIIKSLLDLPAQEVLAEGWDSLVREGLHPLLNKQYESLIAASRRIGEVLAPEDVFELEHRTALADFGERVALRQVLRAASHLQTALPRRPPHPRAGRHEVATNIHEEDTYPVGGFSSLSTRGSVESLLHSQLAFMEKEGRPDLFDVKFVRDELLYYARDENRFLRRRRSYLFALFADLRQTRTKDPALPYQRGVLLLALLLVAVRSLSDWLCTDALRFEFLFVGETGEQEEVLAPERELLRMLLHEPIENGSVVLTPDVPASALARICTERGRRSLCQCLTISVQDRPLESQEASIMRLVLDGPCPRLVAAEGDPVSVVGEEPLETWTAVLRGLLQRLI
jgi:hypothetical protein